jgi:hypothetical protein
VPLQRVLEEACGRMKVEGCHSTPRMELYSTAGPAGVVAFSPVALGAAQDPGRGLQEGVITQGAIGFLHGFSIAPLGVIEKFRVGEKFRLGGIIFAQGDNFRLGWGGLFGQDPVGHASARGLRAGKLSAAAMK